MISIFQRHWNSENILPDEYHEEFNLEIGAINIARTRIFIVLLVVIDCFLVLNDLFISKSAGEWDKNTAFRDDFHAHIFLAAGLFLFFITFLYARHNKSKKIRNTFTIVFSLFIILWCATLSGWIAQRIHGQITEYIIAVFGIASAFFFKPKISAGIFLFSQIVFMLILALVLEDPNAKGHYTNSLALTAIAWFLSVMTYSLRQSEFLSRKKIEEQNRTIESQVELLTEQKYALELANISLLDLNNEKNEFLGIAAHDLKNPLTGILLSADVVRQYAGKMNPAELTQKMQDISRTARRMQEIIINLLDINAIESGKINISLESLDVSVIVRSVCKQFQSRAKEKGIEIHLPTDEVHQVFGDASALTQVFENLISNTVKYSPAYKNVRVWITTSGNAVKVAIQDEGPGLSDSDKNSLFGKFARLSARPTAGEHSTGLGLFIVKKLAEAMNGRVWCESELGHGATFYVVLPVEK